LRCITIRWFPIGSVCCLSYMSIDHCLVLSKFLTKLHYHRSIRRCYSYYFSGNCGVYFQYHDAEHRYSLKSHQAKAAIMSSRSVKTYIYVHARVNTSRWLGFYTPHSLFPLTVYVKCKMLYNFFLPETIILKIIDFCVWVCLLSICKVYALTKCLILICKLYNKFRCV